MIPPTRRWMLLRCPHAALPETDTDGSWVDGGLVPGLCEGRPTRLPESLPPSVVAAVCQPLDADGEWLGELRRRGALDPLVRLLVVETEPGSAYANLARVRAAGARLTAEEPDGRHHLRPRWGPRPGVRSRRALLGLPPLGYDALPTVDTRLCAAEAGCRRCIESCPHQALALGPDGAVVLDPARCTSCGRCVSVCPPRATELLSFGLAALEAEVEQLTADLSGAAVAFACRRRAALPGWAVVEVPCAGAITPGLLLGAAALGAGAVLVAHCGELCRSGDGTAPREAVAAVASLWNARARLQGPEFSFLAAGQLPPTPDPRPVTVRQRPEPGWATHTGLALRALLRAGALPTDPYDEPLEGLGRPTIDPGPCTRCGTCARVCPTGAIAERPAPGGVAIEVDHARCVGCGLCAANCPEVAQGAIRVATGFDPAALDGPVAAVTSEEVRCERCGGPVAPREMIERLRALLGPEFREDTMARRCVDCRGIG
jgi:ferredoxin